MSAQRFQAGLIGRDIAESRSPRMHEREAAAQGMHLEYSLFDFSALDLTERDLPNMLHKLEEEGFSGINVTHPYKQGVIKHLDEMSSEAAKIGAVNTIAFRSGRRIGHNTDVTGFEAGFRDAMDGVALNSVVQIGAGGAGSATAFALLRLGARQLAIHDIDAQRAQVLIDRIMTHIEHAPVALCTNLTAALSAASGIVNATPVGMAEHPGMPVPEGSLEAKQWVADVVYFPLETALLATARRTGCRVMDGSGMAVWQAVGAFEIFTGQPADATRMAKTFLSFDL